MRKIFQLGLMAIVLCLLPFAGWGQCGVATFETETEGETTKVETDAFIFQYGFDGNDPFKVEQGTGNLYDGHPAGKVLAFGDEGAKVTVNSDNCKPAGFFYQTASELTLICQGGKPDFVLLEATGSEWKYYSLSNIEGTHFKSIQLMGAPFKLAEFGARDPNAAPGVFKTLTAEHVAVVVKSNGTEVALNGEVPAGSTITIEATPESGYKLADSDPITVTGLTAGSTPTEYTVDGGDFTITVKVEEVKTNSKDPGTTNTTGGSNNGTVATVVESTLMANLSACPNPVENLLTVKGVGAARSYALFSSMGQQILAGSLNGKTLQLNLGSLRSGVYFLRLVDTKGEQRTLRVVKR